MYCRLTFCYFQHLNANNYLVTFSNQLVSLSEEFMSYTAYENI